MALLRGRRELDPTRENSYWYLLQALTKLVNHLSLILINFLAEPSDRSCRFAIFVAHQTGPIPSLSRSLRLAQMASILGFRRHIRYGSLLRRRNGVFYRDVRT